MPNDQTVLKIVSICCASAVLIIAMFSGVTLYGVYTSKQVELEKAKVTQQEKTERTHTRWDWVPFKRERD